MFRSDTRLLNQLFRNLDRESAKQMHDFFQEKKIFIDINYPRETLKVPAIIILLKGENEETAYLSDTMGFGEVPEALSYDGTLDEGVLGTAASVSSLSGEGPIVFGPQRVLLATTNTLKIDSRSWTIDKWRGGGYTVHVVNGKGKGQTRGITANGQDTLMIGPTWSSILDTTSVFVIRSAANEVVGESRALYKREDVANVERIGSMYGVSYQIQVIGPNPEFTVYLHAVVKSILTIARLYLERQGVINMKLSATDFVPRPDYQPDHTYMRAMTAAFTYPFDVFVQATDIAEQFRVVLEGTNDTGITEILTDITV